MKIRPFLIGLAALLTASSPACRSAGDQVVTHFHEEWARSKPEQRGELLASLSNHDRDVIGGHIRSMTKSEIIAFLGSPQDNMADSMRYDVGHFGNPDGYPIIWRIGFDPEGKVSRLEFDD
ncbi:MAG TPA: hypothetical protein PLI51_03410 [bacterium]|nr:hypothetical protein [bacterium]HPQ65766.1 hypothetical protein [bacterium]